MKNEKIRARQKKCPQDLTASPSFDNKRKEKRKRKGELTASRFHAANGKVKVNLNLQFGPGSACKLNVLSAEKLCSNFILLPSEQFGTPHASAPPTLRTIQSNTATIPPLQAAGSSLQGSNLSPIPRTRHDHSSEIACDFEEFRVFVQSLPLSS